MIKYNLSVVYRSSYEIINWSKEEKNGQLYLSTELLSDDKLKDMTKLENIIDFTQHFKDEYELKDYLVKENMLDEVYLYPQYKIQITYEKDKVVRKLSESVPYKSSIKYFYELKDEKVLKYINKDTVSTHITDLIPQTNKSYLKLSDFLREKLEKNEYLYEEIYKMRYDLKSYLFYMRKNEKTDKDLNVKLERFMESYKRKDSSKENYKIFNKDLEDLIEYLQVKNGLDDDEYEQKFSPKEHWLDSEITYLLSIVMQHELRGKNEKALEFYHSSIKSLIDEYARSSLNTKERYKLGMLFLNKKYEADDLVVDKRNKLEKNIKKLNNYDFNIDNLDIYGDVTSDDIGNVILPKIKENPTDTNIYSALYTIIKNEKGITKEEALEELNKIIEDDSKKEGEIKVEVSYGLDNIGAYLNNDEYRKKLYNLCKDFNVPDAAVYFRDKNYEQVAITIVQFAARNAKFEKALLELVREIQIKRATASITNNDNDNNKFFQALEEKDETPEKTSKELAEEAGLTYFEYDSDYNEPDFPPNSEEERIYSEDINITEMPDDYETGLKRM